MNNPIVQLTSIRMRSGAVNRGCQVHYIEEQTRLARGSPDLVRPICYRSKGMVKEFAVPYLITSASQIPSMPIV